MYRFNRLAMIARWKPVHLGHAAVLAALTDASRHTVIGIGSSNRYDAANPFTAAESADMIRIALAGRSNFEIVEVPDLGHGPRWRTMVTEMLGPLDAFVTANGYVRDLLASDYPIIHPVSLVPPERRVAVDGTTVRRLMATGGNWRSLVPDSVGVYISSHGLDARLRREFGADLSGDPPQTNPQER